MCGPFGKGGQGNLIVTSIVLMPGSAGCCKTAMCDLSKPTTAPPPTSRWQCIGNKDPVDAPVQMRAAPPPEKASIWSKLRFHAAASTPSASKIRDARSRDPPRSRDSPRWGGPFPCPPPPQIIPLSREGLPPLEGPLFVPPPVEIIHGEPL